MFGTHLKVNGVLFQSLFLSGNYNNWINSNSNNNRSHQIINYKVILKVLEEYRLKAKSSGKLSIRKYITLILRIIIVLMNLKHRYILYKH